MKISAGILLYRFNSKRLEVFLVHPGGPFWRNKEEGAWSIPKGETMPGEDALKAAIREFEEETGFIVSGKFIDLVPVKLKSGKIVHAWALEEDVNPAEVKSNTCLVEWPPRSGKTIEIPEVDKGEWFTIDKAKEKINPGQLALIEELLIKLKPKY
jgi:predicted NUDIX family NTP pyrophosphohydrolase